MTSCLFNMLRLQLNTSLRWAYLFPRKCLHFPGTATEALKTNCYQNCQITENDQEKFGKDHLYSNTSVHIHSCLVTQYRIRYNFYRTACVIHKCSKNSELNQTLYSNLTQKQNETMWFVQVAANALWISVKLIPIQQQVLIPVHSPEGRC